MRGKKAVVVASTVLVLVAVLNQLYTHSILGIVLFDFKMYPILAYSMPHHNKMKMNEKIDTAQTSLTEQPT